MKYGLYLPNYGAECSARNLAEVAHQAEEAGWDGFFIWDHLRGGMTKKVDPIVDPWVAMAAIAMSTTRIRFGTTVTPVPRRHPWKLAREAVTLGHLSGGRLILGVGLGGPSEYTLFGHNADPKVLAGMLDEALEILMGLWSGEPFEFIGKHYQISEKVVFKPAPFQQPRIPIWVGGFWPRKGPFLRAARWDGTIPLQLTDSMLLEPKEVREIMSFIGEHRTSDEPFDMVVVGWTPHDNPDKARAKIKPFIRAGATWWLESLYMQCDSFDAMCERVRIGPPK